MATEQRSLPTKPTHIQPFANPQAKADLARVVLFGPEFIECAQAALRWLGAHAGVDHAVCLVVDPESQQLVGLVGDGVPHAQVADLKIDLRSNDPLLIALAGIEPIFFEGARTSASHPRTPLKDLPFHAIPLRRPEIETEFGFGLLLVSGIDGTPGAELEWAASLLATRLACSRFGAAEARRQTSERERAMLERVIDIVTDPILLSDSQGRLVIANTHAEQLFTASEDVSEGRRRAIALNNMLFSAALSTAAGLGESTRRELPLVDPSEGRDLLFELLSATIHQPGGDTAIVSVLRNVQDLRTASQEIEEQYRRLRAAEAETRAERDRLDLIINAVVDPVLVTDPSGNIILTNPPAERLFTVGPVNRGQAAERHVRANDVVFSSFISNLYTTETLRWRGQLSLVDPATGSKLPFEAIAGRAIGKEGEETAVVTILHDHTEALENARLYDQVKQHSEELKRRVQEATAELTQQNELLRQQAIALEQASEAKSRFLANISHELRTPLNAVLGYTDLLRRGMFGSFNSTQIEKLERIDANARHLLSIINDLLDIARIEAGRMEVKLEWFDLAELIEEVMREMESIIARSPLTVTTVLGKGLPQVHSDRQKVKQIALNLLSNSLKFTLEGFIHVRAAYSKAEDQLTISVADTGIGIAEHEQRRIFEDFYQANESPARSTGGTGLGLGICRRLSACLRGRLTVVSKPGSGSTFTLQFPRDGQHEQP